MKRTRLIRLGGLAAMVGGAVYAVQGLLIPPLVRLLVPKDAAHHGPCANRRGHSPERVIPGGIITEDINTAFFGLLILSVMALIAAVHALQVDSYGPGAVERLGLGALTVLPSIVGVALFLVGYLGDIGRLRYQALADLRTLAQYLLILGLVVATVGLLALAIVTLIVRLSPRWVGPAILAGIPPSRCSWDRC